MISRNTRQTGSVDNVRLCAKVSEGGGDTVMTQTNTSLLNR